MSAFKADVPEIAYRFHVKTPRPSFHQGADLSVVWYRGVDNVLWCVRRGISIVCQCNTHSAVEPLVRAWFLGDCIPGIVADFMEERGEGEPWLLGLLRDDPDWYASLPNAVTPEFASTTVTIPDEVDYRSIREIIDQYRGWPLEPLIPSVDWTYRPHDIRRTIHQFLTDRHVPIAGGPVSISGTTE